MTTPALYKKPLGIMKALVFILAGVALVAGALYWADANRRFVARAASAPGAVIRLNAGGAHPEIRFTTAAGKVVEYPQGGMIWGYRVGDKVQVLYEPHDRPDPVINTFGAIWGFTTMDFLLGAVFVAAGILIWLDPEQDA